MWWVLIGLLVLVVSILLSVLQKVSAMVISRRYVPPSNAIIDQSMPEEILEHIFSFTDPLTHQRCSNVSRYWRYHANKNHVKTAVLEIYVNKVQSSEYVRELIAELGPGILRKYSANYSIDNRLYDMALAEKRGKLLLELDLHPQAYDSRDKMISPKATSYILKSPAKLVSAPRFEIGPRNLGSASWDIAPVLCYDEDGVVDKSVAYEVMVNVDDYCNDLLGDANFVMVRNLSKKRNRFGFVTIDGDFLKALAFLFIPLIVHDVLQSEPFMNLLKFWAGPITCCVLTFIIARDDFETLDTYSTYKNAKLFKILVISTATAVPISFILLYPISSSHWALIGMVLAVSVYVWLMFEYVFGESFTRDYPSIRTQNLHRFKTVERRPLMFVCAALVLLMNDWSVTIQSFNDGTIWTRLLWNTLLYLGLPIYAIWNNAMICMIEDRDHVFRWQYFIDWDMSLARQFVYFYGSAVLITVYAPYWQGNP